MTNVTTRMALAAALVCLTAAAASAQQSTTTETKKFQIIAVDGNRLVVKLPEGTKELTVADDFQFNVDGRMLSVRELQPGMSGTATVTTRTTTVPVTVTEVKNGTVMQATGSSIIVRTDNGIKMFTQGDVDKRGVKIIRNGQPAQISDFHANDQLSATIITSRPPKIVTEKQVQATLARSGGASSGGTAAPAQTSSAERSAVSAQRAGTSSASTPGGAARKLPKTGSPLPLVGLTGLGSLLAGLGLTVRRRRSAR